LWGNEKTLGQTYNTSRGMCWSCVSVPPLPSCPSFPASISSSYNWGSTVPRGFCYHLKEWVTVHRPRPQNKSRSFARATPLCCAPAVLQVNDKMSLVREESAIQRVKISSQCGDAVISFCSQNTCTTQLKSGPAFACLYACDSYTTHFKQSSRFLPGFDSTDDYVCFRAHLWLKYRSLSMIGIDTSDRNRMSVDAFYALSQCILVLLYLIIL